MKKANTLKIKICGMRERENILQVAALGPDYMGFIFYSNSKRYVGDNFQLPAEFPSEIKKVGVFVNESSSNIVRIARKWSLDAVQLHGEESTRICSELKKTGLEVIKVFSIAEEFDFKKVDAFRNVVNYFLFDTKGVEYGGTGRAFNWKLLEKYDQSVPFFLSGGLSASNLPDVGKLKEMNLYGLDVNSGVESKPGVKDIALIKKTGILKGKVKN